MGAVPLPPRKANTGVTPEDALAGEFSLEENLARLVVPEEEEERVVCSELRLGWHHGGRAVLDCSGGGCGSILHHFDHGLVQDGADEDVPSVTQPTEIGRIWVKSAVNPHV